MSGIREVCGSIPFRYLTTLTRLFGNLSDPHQPEAMKLIRELVDSVVVYECTDGDPVRFDVKGRLSALLNIADGTGLRQGVSLSAGLVVPGTSQNKTAKPLIMNGYFSCNICAHQQKYHYKTGL